MEKIQTRVNFIQVSNGIIGIPLAAGILFTILLMNSNVVSVASAVSDTSSSASFISAFNTSDILTVSANAVLDAKSISDKYKEKQKKAAKSLKDKRDLTAKRKAAAERYKKARKDARISTAAATGVGTLAMPAGMDPGGIPHYFGPYPNYANSPIPTTTTIGNSLTGTRNTPTENITNVSVVNTHAPLPNGILTEFQTYNQPGSGPNMFHAYVLRPTGIPNQYNVVFDSGLLTVPALPAGNTGRVEKFPVGPIPVQAGDLIAHYGQGIPLDIGLGAGVDVVFHPANTTPTIGTTIDVIAGDATFPLCDITLCSDRTYSIAATVISGGIRKFVDSLPGLGPANANSLGQYIPVAVPDTCTYSGQVADCYEIELREFSEKMHPDLPPTRLRGYVQVKNGQDVAPIHQLGPLIVARRDVPVRITFRNKLPTGAGGDLFLPVDTTVMGAGRFDINFDPTTKLPLGSNLIGNFTQNRATLHLHGGFVPWISDGTPHQWITPAGEVTSYPEGVSVSNVPDMGDPGDGSMTFYYNNQQSARLQFYHDHSFGITRLNVYAGEAAGYLLTDQVEQDLIDGTNISGVNSGLIKVLPDVGIPLIIQDKTFIDNTTIAAQDPTWNWGTGARNTTTGKITGVNTGDLWYPHVYMPNQNPADAGGMNAFGRWHYGPWFWPPTTGITYPPIPNPYCLPTPGVDCSDTPWEPEYMPATPNPSEAAEAFMDTPIVNGAAYPYLEVEPKAYRFRILNAADDRFFNLQLYVADTAVTTPDGRNDTEVKMVPAVATAGFPADWPTDGREGGVPDPATAGPSFIQIGSEGGFLPKPVELPNQPVDWNMDQTNFDMGVVNKGTLILGTAERADVIVNFSAFAGKTLILYNDAPAPFPAIDTRYDYYTGGSDLTDIGGAPTTLPGYGPNTRTIMQIKVGTNITGTPVSADLPILETVFSNESATGKRGVFEFSHDEIIVPQAEYNSAYNKTFSADQFVRIFESSKTFKTVSGATATIPFQPKAIQDEMGEAFDNDYGRMTAMLGLELPNPAAGVQDFILLPYLSPPVELIKGSVYGTQIGSLGDGTQIWKITHNGVDTHTIHVHLFNAQLINRVAWDNARRVPDLNELGWKETIRVNPLQDTIVALRPIAPTQPFKVKNSIRPLDPTMPLGEPLKAAIGGYKDPAGNAVPVINSIINFGWEYIYHCHLLAHEEMDMMHSISFMVIPDAPSNLTAIGLDNPVRVNLTWKDNSADETSFIIQRAQDTGFTTDLANFTIAGNANGGFGGIMTFTDTTVVANISYYYRVLASNVVGDTAVYPPPSIGFPVSSVLSPPSAYTGVSYPTAPAIITQPSSQTVVEGQTATFSVTADGTLPISYQWQKNGTDIAGATGASYTTPPATLPDNGSVFRVNVTNFMGSVISNNAVLTVSTVPSINLIRNPGFESGKVSWTFYTNGLGTFSAGPPAYAGNNSAKIALTTVGTNMQLYQSGIPLEPNTSYELSFAAYSNTGHDVRVRLIKQISPYSTYGLDYTANLGTNWAVFTTQFTTAGFANNVTNGRLQFNFVPFGKAGDIYYIDNVRLEKASTTPVLPGIITHPVDQTVETGQTATFSVVATGMSLSYQWQKNGTDIAGATGASYTTPPATLPDNGSVFRVNVTNPAGSVLSNPATLTVSSPPVTPPAITTQPSNQNAIVGQTATFSVVASGGSLSYQWQKNGIDIPGATSASYTTPPTTLLDNGSTYRVNVTNPAGSIMSNSATLTVSTAVNIILNPGFESGKTSWTFYTNGGGTFSAVPPGYVGNNSAKLAFSTIGTNMQLYQSGVTLEPNTRYQLSFAAYSTTGHDIRVKLFKQVTPYPTYGLDYTANLGTNWAVFTTQFNTTGFTGTVTDGRLQFYLVPFAKAGDIYYIDEVRLEKV